MRTTYHIEVKCQLLVCPFSGFCESCCLLVIMLNDHVHSTPTKLWGSVIMMDQFVGDSVQ